MAEAVTPVAGVEAALARIAAVNPVVNALCLVDAEAARERAHALEERLERGEDTGPLTGWTFTVKDAMRQAGYPITVEPKDMQLGPIAATIAFFTGPNGETIEFFQTN